MQVVAAKSAASTQVVESSDDTPGPESEIDEFDDKSLASVLILMKVYIQSRR